MTNSSLVLAVDQGTTSSRAMLFDRQGATRAIAQAPIDATFPQSGWVNQNANQIWQVTLQVIRDAIVQSAVDPGDIAAIGITNQRETTILWDRATGQPVAPAIVWQSRQSAPLVTAIAERGLSERYQQITGLVPDAYFSATKIAWLLDHDPALRSRAESGDLAFGTVDSWLIWNLTGGQHHVTDCTNAARTMLFDIRTGAWSPELLADLDIPAALLPEVVPSSSLIAETSSDLFGRPIPIAGVAGDQHAALFGQTCFSPGEAKNTYGTGSFLLMQTGEEPRTSTNKLLTTIAWGIGQTTNYALEGAVFVTGAAVQWLRDGLGLIKTAADIEPLAASVPDSGGVYFVPALAGLGAPYWDSAARGAIVGISRGTTSAHLARATLDAIAFQSRDVLDAMTADSGLPLTELRVDGGASVNDLLMQIQADVLGVPVVRPKTIETTALGAAYLAGLATGVWRDQNDLRHQWQEDRRFEPTTAAADRDRHYHRWQEAVTRARHWSTDS